MLYNQALLINDMILFADTLLNMSVNVKLFSNKINLKKIIFNIYQYMTDRKSTNENTPVLVSLPRFKVYPKFQPFYVSRSTQTRISLLFSSVIP